MNEVGYCLSTPFPPQGYVVLASLVLWPPPTPFPQLVLSPFRAYRFALYGSNLAVRGRVSLVPDITFLTCRSPYTGGFFRVAIQVLHTFHGLRTSVQRSAPSCPFRVQFNDAAGFTLNVTACHFASRCYLPLFAGLQVTRFRRCLPASYEAAWSLPRPDFHRLVMPSLARRATEIFAAMCSNSLRIPPFFFK